MLARALVSRTNGAAVAPVRLALAHLKPCQARAIARAQPSRHARAYSDVPPVRPAAASTPQSASPSRSTLAPHSGSRPPITHAIHDLGPDVVAARVVLGGWLTSFRSANARLAFLTLRSARGEVQLVCARPETIAALREVPLESVIQVEGVVQQRVNKKKAKAGASSGSSIGSAGNAVDEVEVVLDSYLLLNPARDLPFYPNHPELVSRLSDMG